MTPKRIFEEACMIKYGFNYNSVVFTRAYKVFETVLRLKSTPTQPWSREVYVKVMFDHYERMKARMEAEP